MQEWNGIEIPELNKWLEKLFASSGVKARLIELEEMRFLEDGEAYSNIVITSKIDFEDKKFFRVTTFSFSKGLEREDLLPVELVISADRDGKINQVAKIRVGKTLAESRILESSHSYAEYTPREKFEQHIKSFGKFVKPLMKLEAVIVKDNSPLLSRYDESEQKDRW